MPRVAAAALLLLFCVSYSLISLAPETASAHGSGGKLVHSLRNGDPSSTSEASSGHAVWSPYWTVAPGFTSTLEMKNNRVKENLGRKRVAVLR